MKLSTVKASLKNTIEGKKQFQAKLEKKLETMPYNSQRMAVWSANEHLKDNIGELNRILEHLDAVDSLD